jgi:DNA-binding MarR family transcriptional regulator
MKRSEVRKFRDTLRRFERLIAGQLKGSSCCSGVTLSQCHALLEIEARGHAALNELAQSLCLDKSTLSRTVDGLVKSGLAERVSNDQDRRSIQLSLSPQGKRICDRINAGNDQLFSRVFERIEPTDRHRVIESFQALVNAMAAEMASTSAVCPPAGQIKRKEGK